ncbi:MAG: type II toxin-antitoxin system VapC family toxin [Acidobacteriaceae bacterium]
MPREIVYWDANAFLGLLNGETDKVASCEDVWKAGERGLLIIVTSTLTVAEVIYVKGASKLDVSKRPSVNNFFRVAHIVQKPLTRIIAELARDVVWDSNVKPKDAVHIATSAYFKIREFHTFDRPLLDEQTISVNGFVVATQKPHAPGQQEMNYDSETKTE